MGDLYRVLGNEEQAKVFYLRAQNSHEEYYAVEASARLGLTPGASQVSTLEIGVPPVGTVCANCGSAYSTANQKFCGHCGEARGLLTSVVEQPVRQQTVLHNLTNDIRPLIGRSGYFVFSVSTGEYENVFFQGASDGLGSIQLEISGPAFTVPALPVEVQRLLIDSGWSFQNPEENFIFVTNLSDDKDCATISELGLSGLRTLLQVPETDWNTDFIIEFD